MNKKLLIIGASGHGKVAADIALKMNCYDKICFLDDNENLTECMNLKIVGTSKEIYNYLKDFDIFVAIGNSKIRKNIIEDLKKHNASIATLIHPTAVIGMNVTIGIGSIIMAGAIINPDTTIGEACIINTSASVDHESILADYVHISVGSHLAGNVMIGSHTWIGIGATVSNNISLGENIMIGAGAVVVKDIINEGTYIGVPAKNINTK